MTTEKHAPASTETALADALQRAIIALSRLAQATSRAEYEQLQLERIRADRDYYAALARHHATTWGKGNHDASQ